MIYEPFFNMNVLVSVDSLSSLVNVVGVLIFFHLILAVYLIYRFVSIFNKSGLKFLPPRI